ncbi:molybdopterin synthase sulfur carrier subunit [Pantoea sp. Nvir]|uniref:molybdopterin synthase sulfur carrier subunit n=1 Tax=Pantoea sp. Nvir TaxID=2576760 RepID=UPI0013584F96|nr:molybdopterin synthase sulfur carrier subunit [Pantoea sp. Nvir]MXP66310.1 molybdopterin synthase sulfur carrier subunit [Pantoea sp. Nvir]CAJ0992911.1 Molybdopterin synthase sulfur carrier subunit [Pantoea sp. Nvir]
MIKILFFAQIRELVGINALVMSDDFADVATLHKALVKKGDRWALALSSGKLLTAVNQTLVPMSHSLKMGDEVAFFPPVTGG